MEPASQVDDAVRGFGKCCLIDGQRDAQMAGTAFAEAFARHGHDVFFVQQARGEVLARQSGAADIDHDEHAAFRHARDDARRIG